MSSKTKVVICLVLYAALAGAMSPVTKIGLFKMPPFLFTFLRFFIASLVITPLFVREKPKFDKSFFSLSMLSLLPVLNVAFFVLGIKLTTASISQMLYGGVPILTGVFGYFLFKNRISLKKWLFILVGLVGVVQAALLPILEKNSLFSGSLTGNLLILIAVTIWSLYGLFSHQFQKKFSPIVITSVFIYLGAVVFFLLALTEFFDLNLLFSSLNFSSVGAIIYVGLLGTVGTYLLNQYAIKHGGPILASLAFYLSPIFGYLISFLLLGEQLTAGLILATGLVFVSVALITYSK